MNIYRKKKEKSKQLPQAFHLFEESCLLSIILPHLLSASRLIPSKKNHEITTRYGHIMGSWTLQLCFSVCAAGEENFANSSVVANNFILHKRTEGQ